VRACVASLLLLISSLSDNPKEISGATGDAYKTLFVGRLVRIACLAQAVLKFCLSFCSRTRSLSPI
jgi:hypothetical protein